MSQKKDNVLDGTDISDRIKNILMNKLQDKTINNTETLELLDTLASLYPDLNEKKNLMNKKSLNNIINDKDSNEIVLDEFKLDDTIYYRDSYGGIWDCDSNLVGIVKSLDKDGNPDCVFFEYDFNLDLDINNINK